MRELYLVRHASPAVQPNVPSEDWTLSARGIEEARALAAAAARWKLAAIYSSAEPKARATALIIGDAVGLPVGVVDGLQELRFDRFIANSDAFGEQVRQILTRPDIAVHGAERAGAAAARFAAAVQIVAQGEFPAAVVSHGRILTAYLADLLALPDPFALWRSLPMPSWARIDLDDLPSEVLFEGVRDGA